MQKGLIYSVVILCLFRPELYSQPGSRKQDPISLCAHPHAYYPKLDGFFQGSLMDALAKEPVKEKLSPAEPGIRTEKSKTGAGAEGFYYPAFIPPGWKEMIELLKMSEDLRAQLHVNENEWKAKLEALVAEREKQITRHVKGK